MARWFAGFAIVRSVASWAWASIGVAAGGPDLRLRLEPAHVGREVVPDVLGQTVRLAVPAADRPTRSRAGLGSGRPKRSPSTVRI